MYPPHLNPAHQQPVHMYMQPPGHQLPGYQPPGCREHADLRVERRTEHEDTVYSNSNKTLFFLSAAGFSAAILSECFWGALQSE
jgi:hypothetical protein